MVGRLIQVSAIAVAVYIGLLGLTYFGFKKVPTGFIPPQDKGYVVMIVQLPDAASLERTEKVVDHLSEIARHVPGVMASIDLAGLNGSSLTASANSGTIFLILDEFDKRRAPNLSSDAIVAELRKRCAGVQEGFVGVFPPPAVNGLGVVGGFKLQVEDRGGLGLTALQDAATRLMFATMKEPALTNVFSSFRAGVPQVYLDVDRVKAKSMKVPLSDIFDIVVKFYLRLALCE